MSQGDEPLIDPSLIDAVAAALLARPDAAMSTAVHAIDSLADYLNPNVVKAVLDAQGNALYFSRAPIPWWRDGASAGARPLGFPRRLRCATSASTATGPPSFAAFRRYPCRRSKASKPSSNCARCGTGIASWCM